MHRTSRTRINQRIFFGKSSLLTPLFRWGVGLLFCSFVFGNLNFARAESDGQLERFEQKERSLAARKTSGSSLRAYEGFRISEIQILGLKRIEKEAVIAKIQSKKGKRLKLETVSADIQDLFAMGYFDDIEVRAQEGSRNTVRLNFRLRERPVISELVFEGNEKVSTEDLEDVIRLKEWAILDINLVREDVDRIQKHYEDKGFYLAKADFLVEENAENKDQVTLIFKINDFEKVEIKKISFLNNHVFSDTQLKKVFFETSETGFFSFLSGSGSFKESSFKQDLNRLTFWYLDNGYIKFRYENPVVTVTDDKRWLHISVYVDEGKPYTINSIDFGGDLLFTKEELFEAVEMKKEDLFRISIRNKDIQSLTEKYQDLGYAFVNVIPKMQINDENRTIDLTYHFEKGNLVYFGEIRILGNTKTHDDVIRRELRVHEGELYSGTNLRISRERVERLGYFAPGQVVFNTLTRKGRDDIVDLEITVTERSTGTITLGAGYGSVQKFFLTTQISEINLFGKGQTLSLQAQYASDSISRSLNLGFTDPYAFGTHWSMGFDIFSTSFPIPDRFNLRKLGFNLRLGHPLSDNINAFITYKREGTNISLKDDPRLDTSLDEGILSSVVWSVVRDKRNNRFETSDGNYQSVSVETAGLGGDKTFLKAKVNNRVYFKVVGDLVFKNSTEYGHITPLNGPGVPTAERFSLGGPNNMKGFRSFSLGPKQTLTGGGIDPDTGLPFEDREIHLGGLVEMFSLFELEYPLIREAGLKFVGFFDVGNAFERFPGTGGEPFTLRADWGFGFRWFSPIGPLRFEWGFPLNKKANEDSPNFSFFIGPPF